MADAEAERAALATRLARDVNCLRDGDRFKRKRGVDTLARELFDGAKVRAAS